MKESGPTERKEVVWAKRRWVNACPAMVRQRIVDFYEQDYLTSDIAEVFGVCESGLRRVRQNSRERGTLEPLPRTDGRKPLMTPDVERRLCEDVARQPDATREEIREALGLTAVDQQVAQAAGAAAQKTLHATEQDRPDVAERRAAWHAELRDVAQERLVFLDESGARADMTRTHGGPRTASGSSPRCGHWRVVTVIGAHHSRAADHVAAVELV
jgi:hypothetical protein